MPMTSRFDQWNFAPLEIPNGAPMAQPFCATIGISLSPKAWRKSVRHCLPWMAR
jgi:hypothetical protein